MAGGGALEFELELELELALELEVVVAGGATFVVGGVVPGQFDEPHPVRPIVARARETNNHCRNQLALMGE